MRGAIIEDIIGSTHEFVNKVDSKDFELFPLGSDFTDDSVLTIAVQRKQRQLSFREYYGLKVFNLKEMDKYLWQLGEEYFPKDY